MTDKNSLFYQLPNNLLLEVIIIDTAGQERFRALNTRYYRQADGILLVFDITNKQTFEELTNYYLDQIKDNCKENIPSILLGNKSDLEEKREVTKKEALAFALEYKYLYFETSCKDNINIIDAFDVLIENGYKEKLNKKDIIESKNNLVNHSAYIFNKPNYQIYDNIINSNFNNNINKNINNNINFFEINNNINNNINKDDDKNGQFSLDIKNENKNKNKQSSSSCC